MKLTAFRITNFRSINDSGQVSVGKLTSLVGRNESGKSNLLLDSTILNPPGGMKDLNSIKDFPRHRRLSECSDDTPVVSTDWELTDAERHRISRGYFPGGGGNVCAVIGRRYKASLWVSFTNLKPISFSASEIAARVRKIQPVIEATAEKLEVAPQQEAKAAIAKLTADLNSADNYSLGSSRST